MQKTSAQTVAGFTIVEVLFVVVILMIGAAIGVPSFTNLMRSNNVTASVNDVVTAIQLARSEASKRGIAVTLCPSGNIDAAEPACDPNGDWEDGYIAFVDANANGTREAGPDEVMLHAQSALPSRIFVRASAAVAGGLTYGGDGFPVALANALATMVFCDDPNDVSNAKLLAISSTGRPMVVRNESMLAGLQCS